jgi:hypothetical protein
MILVLDIDGTLANTDHRAYLVECEKPDWDAFFSSDMVEKDSPFPEAQKVLQEMTKLFDDVYFISGRRETLRETTKDWLKKHYDFDVEDDHLFLRDDHTPPSKFKKSIVENKLKDHKDLVFIDDEEGNLEIFQDSGKILKAPECWIELGEKTMEKNSMQHLHAAIKLISDAFAGPYQPSERNPDSFVHACPFCGIESEEFAAGAKKCPRCGADISVPSADFTINNAPNEEFLTRL